MCCQITPAIGIPPMKPITTMRLRFIREEKTPMSSLEFFDGDRRIPCDNGVRRNALRDNGARGNHRVLADGYAFQNHGVHSDPNVVTDFDGRGFQFWPWRSIFKKRSERMSVDQTLRWLERVKIWIGNSDTP